VHCIAGKIAFTSMGITQEVNYDQLIHLMPGDHQYSTPEIPIVIVWNGINHHCPTYLSNSDDIINWKLSLVNRQIKEAISIFGEVEGDLDDAHDFEVCEQMHSLMSTAVNTQKMLASSSKHVSSVVIPPSHIGPDPRDIMTSLTRTTTLAKHPVPSIKGFMSVTLESVVDVAAGSNPDIPLVPQITEVVSTQEQQATPQVAPTQGKEHDVAPTKETQSHSKPIPAPRIIPPPPNVSQSDTFNFPLRQFLEVKRKTGGGAPFKKPKAPAPKAKPKTDTDHSLILSIPLDDLPPVTSSSASAPVSSSPAASSSVQSAVKRLASAAVQSVVGKGRSAGKGKGKGPMKFTCIESGCSYSTFNKGDFNIHMDKHRGIKYNCGSCDKSFGSTKSRD
ncbi:MAG: hypothetical protein MJE68_14560, partial [Proteobacteria bacterium]|nr:hypothetical protein [Pseudomonadota bacterium]